MSTDARVIQRGIGALVGAAVGDALGAPFEFRHRGLYLETFPEPVLGGRGEMTGGGPWEPAEFTDDTQMAIALAESLLAHDGLDPADLWKRWQAWARGSKDVGILTRHALAQPEHEGAAKKAHDAQGRSGGNGTIMRNVPVALFDLGGDVVDMHALAAAQSALTHFDEDCAHAAVLHVAMIRAGVLGDDMWVALDRALESLPSDARARFTELTADGWKPDDAKLGNGTVWTCLAQAIWALRTSDSFEETVVRAVNLGDDADTVGAVAGSLAGARWGIQAVPSRWTTYLHGTLDTPSGRRAYDYSALQDLARALMGKGSVPLSAPEPAAGPVRVDEEFLLHAADWKGAAGVSTDWAIVSLCRTGGDFVRHEGRRELFLVDRYDVEDNLNPLAVLRDAVDTIEAFLAEAPDRPVVVHCHGGRSRTAFVLKGWLMRRYGWTEQQAHDHLVARWPRAHRDNPVFQGVLVEEWS